MHTTLTAVTRAALAAALLATAACGGGERDAADTAAGAIDSTLPGPGVGDAAMDSGYRAGQNRLDSLKAAGVTPAGGLQKMDSAAGQALAVDSNTSTRMPPVTPTTGTTGTPGQQTGVNGQSGTTGTTGRSPRTGTPTSTPPTPRP